MLADFRVLYGALAAGVVGVLVVQLARGHSPYDVLGSYSVTGHATYRPDQVLKWLLYHVAELDLYLGIVPFAALVLLTFVGRSLDRPLARLSRGCAPVDRLAAARSRRVRVGALAAHPGAQPLLRRTAVPDRPAGLDRARDAEASSRCRGRRRARRRAARSASVSPPHRCPRGVGHACACYRSGGSRRRSSGLDTIPIVVVAAAAAIGLLFLSISPRYALVLPAVVLLWFAFATERIERFDHGFPKASIGALYQGITAPRRDWVDAAVGRNADVAFVFSGKDKTHHPDTLWENEFYNRSIGPCTTCDSRRWAACPRPT